MCGKLETLWIPYLDGKLGPRERERVEAHLRECAECAQRREEFVSVGLALGAWEAPAPSPWFDARLRAKLAAELRPRLLDRWMPGFASFPLSIAVLLFLAALLVWTGNPRHDLAPQQTVAVSDAKMDELLHAADEVDMLNDFELLSELKKPVER